MLLGHEQHGIPPEAMELRFKSLFTDVCDITSDFFFSKFCITGNTFKFFDVD